MTSQKLFLSLATGLLLAASSHGQGAFSDDFDRADSTDLGSNWTEWVGDWQILDNAARSHDWDLTTEKLLIHEPVIADRPFVVEADIAWPTLQNQWNGLIWNVQAQDTYYMFRMRADNGSVQIIRRVDGGNASVPLNVSGAAGAIEQGTFCRMSIRGDGEGTLWWSVKSGQETLASGSFVEPAGAIAAGPAGIYAGRESIAVDHFRVEAFSFEAGAPDVAIETAVEVFFPTVENEFYQIQSSTDLEAWTAAGALILGTGGEISEFFATRGTDRRFFRVVTSASE